MTPPAPRDSPASHQAWWIWTLGQAAILAVYANRVKLTGGYPDPVEATADLGVACIQLVLAALLGPALLEGRSRLIGVGAVAAVYAVLAAPLAHRTVADTARLGMVTALWLIALARLTRSPLGRQTAVFLAVAGPVLFYAGLEYAVLPIKLGEPSTLLSPVLGVCTTRLHSAVWKPVAVPMCVILTGTMETLLRKTAIRRDRDIYNANDQA